MLSSLDWNPRQKWPPKLFTWLQLRHQQGGKYRSLSPHFQIFRHQKHWKMFSQVCKEMYISISSNLPKANGRRKGRDFLPPPSSLCQPALLRSCCSSLCHCCSFQAEVGEPQTCCISKIRNTKEAELHLEFPGLQKTAWLAKSNSEIMRKRVAHHYFLCIYLFDLYPGFLPTGHLRWLTTIKYK